MKKYKALEIETIEFNDSDIIVTSNGGGGNEGYPQEYDGTLYE